MSSIYKVIGLKHHNNTKTTVYEKKCYIREIMDIDDDEVEIPSMVQTKTDQWPLTENKTRLLHTNVLCQIKSPEPKGGKEKQYESD